MWLFYTLLAAILWSFGQIYVKKGLKHTSALFNNLYSTTVGFIIFVPFALLHGINTELIIKIIPYGLIITSLYLAYYYAIGKGQLSLTGTVIGASPLFTIILSLLFFT